MKIVQLPAFQKEIAEFPIETREDIWKLLDRYLKGERLPKTQFKTFKIDRKTKIQEFKVKDHLGNWRAISFIKRKASMFFVYAFHKKSEKLEERDKFVIRQRILRIPYEV